MESNQTANTVWKLGCIGMVLFSIFQVLKIPFILLKVIFSGVIWFLTPAANIVRWIFAIIICFAFVATLCSSVSIFA